MTVYYEFRVVKKSCSGHGDIFRQEFESLSANLSFSFLLIN